MMLGLPFKMLVLSSRFSCIQLWVFIANFIIRILYNKFIVRSHHSRQLMTFLIYKKFRSQSSQLLTCLYIFLDVSVCAVHAQMGQTNILFEGRKKEENFVLDMSNSFILCDCYYICDARLIIGKLIERFGIWNQYSLIWPYLLTQFCWF